MMSCIKIKAITTKDIPMWMELSKEHDDYVKEVGYDLIQW
ncbi:hypothetical protein J2Z44_003629 [Clostridium punense]|uniref:GNAT family N-acetyltransferase n=1 Tax=Clostridium punense TaxID=1054297 RepID=A0ABS4K7L3_9CLOT|nr:hypothetical protein M918_09340 [Clostridium sp. BL8]MBP2023787.1 hypothetical protein [Clostridium punense]